MHPVGTAGQGQVGPVVEDKGYAGRGRDIPWFVTGGATPDTIPAMAEAGARRFVAVRYLTESDDPEAAARRLRAAIDPYWD